MSDYSLTLLTATYEKENRESLVSALKEISDFDYEFSGQDSDIGLACCKYMDLGYECNQDFCLDVARESVNADETIINGFMKSWLDGDHYYQDWSLKVNDTGNSCCISVALLTHL